MEATITDRHNTFKQKTIDQIQMYAAIMQQTP